MGHLRLRNTGISLRAGALQRENRSKDVAVGVHARKNGYALEVPAGQEFYLYLDSPI
jgi:hypothetical protein